MPPSPCAVVPLRASSSAGGLALRAERRLLTLLSVLLAFACVAAPARGQGMNGSLPGPIGTEEVVRYGERLGLSPEQLQAALRVLDGYRDEFERLRTSAIDPYLEQYAGMSGLSIPARETVEAMLEEQERLLSRIERLDQGFFDALAPILSPGQLAVLERVRLARERARLSATDMDFAMFAGAAPDLAELFAAFDLPAGDAGAQADAILVGYEKRLVSVLRDVRTATNGMMLKLMDGLAAAGFGEMSQEDFVEDPAAMQRMMEAMQDIWAVAWEDAGKAHEAAKDLNRTTWRRLAAVLPESDRVPWRNAYYQRSYPMMGGLAGISPSIAYTQALTLDDLDGDARAALEAGRDETIRAEDRMLEEGAKIFDENFAGRSPFDFDMESFQAMQERIQKLAAEAETLRQETDGRIVAVAGENWRSRLDADALAKTTAPRGPRGFVGGMGIVVEEAVAVEPVEDQGSALAPRRLAGRTLERMADALDLDRDARAALMELHEAYVGTWRDEPAFADLDRIVFQGEEIVADDADSAARIVRSAYDRAVDAARGHDAVFFDRVASALPSVAEHPWYGALRRLRDRDLLRSGQSGMFMPGGSREPGEVDLVGLLFATTDDAEAIDLGLAALVAAGYEEELLGALAARRDASIAMQAANARWIRLTSAMEPGDFEDAMDIGQRYQEIIGTTQRRYNEADEVVGRLNRRTVDGLLEALAPAGDAAIDVRDAWRVAAYPQVYRDPMDLNDHLRRALALETLRDDQRERVIEITTRYRPAYEAACDRLVAVLAEGERMTAGDWQEVDWAAWRERQQTIRRILEERQELSLRAATELRAALDEAQLALLGPLPEPTDADNLMWFW